MVSLRLENTNDSIDLAGVENNGTGVQALAGSSGFGLPPVQGQWVDGAGDGSSFRANRTLARDIDLVLHIVGKSHDDLKSYFSRLALVFADKCKLVFVDGREATWHLEVHRTGGGDFVWGQDTISDTEAQIVVSVRAGQPYWVNNTTETRTVAGGNVAGLLTGSLAELHTSAAMEFGSVILNNYGDAPVYPTWTIHGPGTDFQAISPDGDTLEWNGTLAQGEVLTIDTNTGTVVDQNGVNRYDDMASRPRMWPVKPGQQEAVCVMSETNPDHSKIEVSWAVRRWWAI